MQKEIKFGGLNNATNGRLVQDGAMGEMMNLMPGADGLSVVTLPELVDHGTNNELMYIHHLPDGGAKYIYRGVFATQLEDGSLMVKRRVLWKDSPSGEINIFTEEPIVGPLGELVGVDSLGNTLILRWTNHMEYVLWRVDKNAYEMLGERPPMATIQFGIKGSLASYPEDKQSPQEKPKGYGKYPNEAYGNGGTSHIDESGWIVWNETFYKSSFPCDWTGYEKRVPYTGGSFSAESMYTMAIGSDDNDEANGGTTTTVVMTLTNLVMGAVNKFVATQGNDKNKFIMPFLVRYAYRMHDGTHIMHSAPVLLMPNSKAPVCWWRKDSSIQERHKNDKSYSRREPYVYAKVSAVASKLMARYVNIPAELYKWRDVIQGIDIYVSQPLYTYEQDKPVFGWDKMYSDNVEEMTQNWAPYFHEGNLEEYNQAGTMPIYAQRQFYNLQSKVYNYIYCQPRYKFSIKERSEADIAKDVKTCSTFFKVSSINMSKLAWKDGDTIKTSTDSNISRMKEVEMEKGILNSLTSQEKLDDDYNSHYSKAASTTYIYNNRLNIGDVTEEVNAEANACIASMPTNFVGYSSGKPYYWKAEIELIKNGKSVFVREPAIDVITGYDADFPRYIFVPDADAKRIYLTRYLSTTSSGLLADAGLTPTAGVTGVGSSTIIGDSELGGEDIENIGGISGDDIAGGVGGDDYIGNDVTDAEGIIIDCDPKKLLPIIIGGDDNEGGVWYPIGENDAYTGKNVGTYCIELEPHQFLNGAVWFKGYNNAQLPKVSSTHTASGMNYTERVNYLNKIYTSNAANPFKFEPTNINTIGTGRILAMRSAVTPVRANQVGQLSMYAFSEDGVWSLKVSSNTGGWSGWEIVNGDVLSNADSVCQLDNAVAYITAQGVTILQGAESACMSSILDGRMHGVVEALPGVSAGKIDQLLGGLGKVGVKFEDYCKNARLAYDYTNQRLICYNGSYNYYYIYNIANPGWGCANERIYSAVNDYPKTWVNCKTKGYVAELSAKHDDEQSVKTYFITRATKLDAPDALKTISNLIVRGNFGRDNLNAVVLLGSRDLINWHVVGATDKRVRAIGGSGYKYFKLLVSGVFPSWVKIDAMTIELLERLGNKLI